MLSLLASAKAGTSGGQNKFSSVRVKIPCRGGVRRGEIMAPRPSGGAKIWCHHRPLSRKRTVVVGKSNQSLLLSLPPTHYPNSSQSQKILPVLDVLGLLHQEALALKKRHRDPRSRATQQACCREREEVKKRGILEAWRERGGENLVSSRPPEAKILSGERPPSRKYGVTPKKSVRENLFCTALVLAVCRRVRQRL